MKDVVKGFNEWQKQDIERMIGKRPYEKQPVAIEEAPPTPMLDPLNKPKVEDNKITS